MEKVRDGFWHDRGFSIKRRTCGAGYLVYNLDNHKMRPYHQGFDDHFQHPIRADNFNEARKIVTEQQGRKATLRAWLERPESESMEEECY